MVVVDDFKFNTPIGFFARSRAAAFEINDFSTFCGHDSVPLTVDTTVIALDLSVGPKGCVMGSLKTCLLYTSPSPRD